MTGRIRVFAILTLFVFVSCVLLAGGLQPPETPKKPVVDEYHGKSVTDNYRWLDDATNHAVQRWTEAQNKYTRAEIEKFPQLKALGKRLLDLIAAPSADYFDLRFRGNTLFAMAPGRDYGTTKAHRPARPSQ